MKEKEKIKGEIDLEKKIVKLIIDIAMEFGQEKKGSFFVITNRNLKPYYSWLYTNILEKTRVKVNDKRILPLIKKLAELDGAIIIDEDGYLCAYGAQIKKIKQYKGHGTRHSAALGISEVPGTISIISSEEDGAVRIMKGGKTLVEINPFTKTPPTLSEKIAELITSPSLPLIGGGSIGALALGLNPFMAAIVFTGSYIITKSGAKSLSEFLKQGPKAIQEKKKE
jgi:hypothetical protein